MLMLGLLYNAYGHFDDAEVVNYCHGHHYFCTFAMKMNILIITLTDYREMSEVLVHLRRP